MTTGAGAAITLAFAGQGASPATGEVDLAIDAAGDALAIDGAGDVLIAIAALTFTGASASIVAPDFAQALEGEGWVGFETEAGQTLETEGA